jgi:hypothetical protein
VTSSDLDRKLDERRYIYVALLAAFATFIAGFGAMSLLYFAGSWPAGLRGLYSFKSATYGDALLIPLMVGILVRTYLLLQNSDDDRVFLLYWAIPGVAIGIFTQWLWLRNPHPALNWTLPAPHTFNIAGWYHAAFLTLISGLLSSLTIGILVGLRRLRRRNASDYRRIATSPWVVVVAASAAEFLVLLNADNTGSNSSSSGPGTFAVACAAVFLVVLVAALILGRPALELSRNLYVGAVGAIGMTTCIESIVKYDFALYEIGLAILIAVSGSIMIRSAVAIPLVTLSIWATFGWVMLTLSLRHTHYPLRYISEVVVLIIVAVSIPLAQARKWPQFWSWLKCALAPEVVIICYLLTRWFFQSGTGGVSNGVGWLLAALTLGIANHVKRDFAAITHAERMEHQGNEARTRQLWVRSWTHFTCLALAGVPVVAYFTVAGPYGSAALSHATTVTGFRAIFIVVSVSLGCAIIATVIVLSNSQGRRLARRARFEDVGEPIHNGWSQLSRTLIISGSVLQCTVCVYVIASNLTSAYLLASVLSALISVLFGLWVHESFMANTCSLQGRRGHRISRLIGLLVALSAGLTCLYVMRFGVISGNHGPLALSVASRSLLLLFQVAVMCVLASIVVLASDASPRRNTEYPEYFGVLQDEFLVTALVILTGVLPVYVWSQLGLSVHSVLDVLGYCVPLLVPFGLLFYMAIEENRKHLKAETAVTEALTSSDVSPEAVARRHLLRPLTVHIRFQNMFALVLVILSIVPLLTLFNRDNPVTEYWQVLRQSLS